MTKKELDEWAEETLGLALDRRKKKADMIEIVKRTCNLLRIIVY